MGSLGADEAGEDMTVGRTNKSEERTLLIAINGAPNGYADYSYRRKLSRERTSTGSLP